jgi:(2Fe-2S) ferredoxin
MNQSPLPYKQLIFVCTNARKPGERISCAGADRCGQEILDRLKNYVKENKLQDTVRIAKSGCQEKCEMGPNVAVMPQNDFLSNVTLEDVDTIINTYLDPSSRLSAG